MSRRAKPEDVWNVPIAIADVPETGRRVDLVPDQAMRDAIARTAGLVTLPRLEATFDLARHGHDGLRVVGRVSATVGQTCVVTLDPVENEIDEAVDLLFQPETAASADTAGLDAAEPPETLRNGMVDLGTIVVEFLMLGIDPYPRKPGVVFDAPRVEDSSSHPFAALAALKKDASAKD